jgi:hypothetical protein
MDGFKGRTRFPLSTLLVLGQRGSLIHGRFTATPHPSLSLFTRIAEARGGARELHTCVSYKTADLCSSPLDGAPVKERAMASFEKKLSGQQAQVRAACN